MSAANGSAWRTVYRARAADVFAGCDHATDVYSVRAPPRVISRYAVTCSPPASSGCTASCASPLPLSCSGGFAV